MAKIIFWFLIGNFIFILSQLFIPAIRDLFKGSLLFLLPLVTFFLLGALLIFFTIKEKTKGKLKKFLLLTGVSAAGFFISVLLHNFLYGLAKIAEHLVLLFHLLEALQVIFFIIAIFVCPIGFLIGMAGSLLFFNKKRGSN